MMITTRRTIKNASENSIKTSFLFLLIPSLFVLSTLSACGKSDAEICIDEKSHLWNAQVTQSKSKEENRAYWDAVSQCREKYK